MMIGSLAARASSICLQEDALLNVARRVVVKVIQADLAPGDDPGMAGPLFQTRVGGVVGEVGFVRMDADAGPDFRILRACRCTCSASLNAAIGGVGSVAVSDGEIGFDPARLRARQHLVAIGVVALAFEMGVGVDNTEW